jgi:acyl-homoserine lactone acylase PvdQ
MKDLEAVLRHTARSTDPGRAAASRRPRKPTGSTGIAVAPSNTSGKHALLLINLHTSFFFRSRRRWSATRAERYGASTWGASSSSIRGFNERSGWMHTSSGRDNIDEYSRRS